jgi:hypothetical protein
MGAAIFCRHDQFAKDRLVAYAAFVSLLDENAKKQFCPLTYYAARNILHA